MDRQLIMKPDGEETSSMAAVNPKPANQEAPMDAASPSTQTSPPETTPASSKTPKEKSADAKAKAVSKTKAPLTSARPSTGQNRLTNGAQKSQANGVAKKPSAGGVEKKTLSNAAAKKPATPLTKPPTKVLEKKANGVKTPGAAPALKRTPSTAPAEGAKPKPKTAAPASRPGTASTIKSSSKDSPKPNSNRSVGPSTATPKPAAPKTPTSRPSTATPKTPSSATKPAATKTTVPSAARTPTPKTATPGKKDVSKQPTTPAAKKPASSPLTRSTPSKTTKPDTPKAASAAKAESTPKKPAPSSKAAEMKATKPKESKATPSKEVTASPKTTGTKPSAKASSPKKSVGSSTPMSLKGGPKSTVPSDKKAEVKDVATTEVAPAVASAAIASLMTSEGASKESTKEVIEDVSTEEVKSEELPSIPASLECPKVDIEETVSAATFADAPEGSGTTAIASEDRTKTPVSHICNEPQEEAISPLQQTPEDIAMPILPPTSPKETLSAFGGFEETSGDTTKPVIPPTSYEPGEETVSPVTVPESEDLTTCLNRSNSFETRKETISPNTTPAFGTLATSVTSYEQNLETISPNVAPGFEDSIKTREESVSPLSPPLFAGLTRATIPPSSLDAPEQSESSEEEPEDSNCPELQFSSEQEVRKAMDSAKSQMVGEVDLDIQEEAMATESPLGTTVLSPPSSPVVPTSFPVSSLLKDIPCPVDQWARSSSLGETKEDEEQDEESEEDREKEEDFKITATAEHLMGEFEMFGCTNGERKAAPVSLWQEQDEAVEKAEEEINEDNEEEEEEDEIREFAVEEPLAQTKKEECFGSRETDFARSEWGTRIPDDMFGGSKPHSEVVSPFNAGSMRGPEEMAEFLGHEADENQPFTGPPGIQSFGSEDEEEDDEEEHLKEDMDLGSDQEEEQQQNELRKQDVDVEMVYKSKDETSDDFGNEDEDDYTEETHTDLKRGAQATSMPEGWSRPNLLSDPIPQPASLFSESSLYDSGFPETTRGFATDPKIMAAFSADPDTPPKSPVPPPIHASEPDPETQDETGCSVPATAGALAAPAIGMSQSSTLSGTALAAHSSSETSTPEELREYDSSSGVESRSDKQQTPVPAVQTDMEQDLGIHLERGDGDEEEAETLPADEILGDAATAPASVPSSPSTSGDEASDTEGEMQINDPDAVGTEKSNVAHKLSALEEDEDAPEQIGEEDGGTPQSANSVGSYGFDCSASNSNAHSMAESCGKSPGIFSLENEEHLPEEAKDPCFIKELTLPAATAYGEDLFGCPLDLMPLSEPSAKEAGFDQHYYSQTGSGPMEEEMDPESPMHLSPQHEHDSDGQPPYYSALCDKTDNSMAGKV
ncbi:hypothetical protein DNTS_022125 [Danionella cerebrum]|uniref:Uncharacterized protein n=1 Tax=Danionella cerebrum TaxID=2873325 RepID=A0A553R0L6_9TELE|nr:hypothetical protein DNTS_022125 [Danionella translucida]